MHNYCIRFLVLLAFSSNVCISRSGLNAAAGVNLQQPGFGSEKFAWMNVNWNSPDKYKPLKTAIHLEVNKYIKAKNDIDLNYYAEKAFREWKDNPNSMERLYNASMWYYESFCASYKFSEVNEHAVQYNELALAWRTTGDPQSAEFTRLGYLIWAVRNLSSKLGDLCKDVVRTFPEDTDVIHIAILEAYTHGQKDTSFLELLRKKNDKKIREIPLSFLVWKDRAMIYEKMAIRNTKLSYLDVAESAILKSMEIKGKNRVNEEDRFLLADIKRLRYYWKDKWKK